MTNKRRLRVERRISGDLPRVDLEGEVWRSVVGFEGAYEVSNLGRVWSCSRYVQTSRCGGHSQFVPGRMMKQRLNAAGYPVLSLQRPEGPKFNALVHSLVCEAFHGPRPKGMQCAHIDGSKDNNVPDNLAWVSQEENQSHRLAHGTDSRGEKSGQSKVSAGDVAAIRQRAKSGEKQRDLAREYGLRETQISRIVHRKSWAHLEERAA